MIEYIKFWLAEAMVELFVTALIFGACYAVFLFMKGRDE